MEQESHHKRDAEETTEFQSPNIPVPCANNCGFFGSSTTNNLCSKCYRDYFLSESKASIATSTMTVESAVLVEEKAKGGDEAEVKVEAEVGNPSTDATAKKPANRCGACNKRVGLMGFMCRCGNVFCSLHRYSDEHGCQFDYKGTGQDAIAKANPVVKPDKVDKI